MRLLLVEDEARMARFIVRGLKEQAYAVDLVTNGEDALYQAAINAYDAIILDVMIPRKDGFTVCRELRAEGVQVPVLMLTARDAVEDRIAGLDTGAETISLSRSSSGNSWRDYVRSCGGEGSYARLSSR